MQATTTNNRRNQKFSIMKDSDYLEGRLYVGGLNPSATKDDVERAFSKYGKIIDLWLARNPPGFAFVEFSSQHDADECLRALDGTDFMGSTIKVELSRAMPGGRGRGRGRGGRGGRGGGRGPGGGRDRDRGYASSDSYSEYAYRSRSPIRRRSPAPYSPPRNRDYRGRDPLPPLRSRDYAGRDRSPRDSRASYSLSQSSYSSRYDSPYDRGYDRLGSSYDRGSAYDRPSPYDRVSAYDRPSLGGGGGNSYSSYDRPSTFDRGNAYPRQSYDRRDYDRAPRRSPPPRR